MDTHFAGGIDPPTLRVTRAGRRVQCGALLLATALLAACAGTQPSIPSNPHTQERAMSEMTSEQLAHAVVRLILAIGGKRDLTPTQVAAYTGLHIAAQDNTQSFGASGQLADGSSYALSSVADADGLPPSRLDITFSQAPGRAAPVDCAQPIGPYRQALVDAGFVAQWIAPPRLGSLGRWHFERGDIVVYAFVGKDAAQDDARACVSTVQILATA
ncbi:hypothetical protein EIQ22_13865 [Xanthomonas campestris pv. campestris]